MMSIYSNLFLILVHFGYLIVGDSPTNSRFQVFGSNSIKFCSSCAPTINAFAAAFFRFSIEAVHLGRITASSQHLCTQVRCRRGFHHHGLLFG